MSSEADTATNSRTQRPELGGHMSLIDHLRELRNRIVKVAIAVVVGMLVAWIFYPSIFAFLRHPYCAFMATQDEPCRLVALDPLEPLTFRLQVATYGGIFLAAPVTFYQMWRFIAPGLYRNERRYAAMFVGSSLVLFFAGAAVAYATMPTALSFLLKIGGDNIENLTRISPYITFLLFTMLAFAAGFQFPILLFFLQITGLVQPETLTKHRREAIVAITALAALLTPSVDPISMFALAIPMYLLYETSIVAARIVKRRRAQREA